MGKAQVRKKLISIPGGPERDKLEEFHKICTAIDDVILTISIVERLIDKHNVVNSESNPAENAQSDGFITTALTSENFTDVTGGEIKESHIGDSSYPDVGQKNFLSLDDFWGRPCEIYKGALGMGGSLNWRLGVWDLWSKVPAVRAKLRNYAYFRGNLHVRISVSGTPFDYGRFLASYQPYAQYNETLGYLLNMLLFDDATFRPLVLNYLSQAEGSAIINVNENVPVEFVCPFMSTKPVHRLFNTASGSAIAAATSFDDLQYAGDVFFYTVNPPACVSATPSDIYVQVYAWATDVELGTNTGTQVEVTTESRPSKKKDERETGPVERIATNVALVSKSLTQVPFLEPFARASEITFGALGSVAALFGWSKPVMLSPPTYVKNEPYRNGAVTIGTDTAKRIVLDPKQELHVDPRMLGVSEDCMTINHLTRRMAYLYTFTWRAADDAMVAPIWTCKVNPSLVTSALKVGRYYCMPTPMAMAAFPFEYWRGSIRFRIEVVCSAFHRGKIGVFYEPNIAQYTLITADINLNKQYIKVVDIQETQTFEVCVNWNSYREWLRVRSSTNARLSCPGDNLNDYAYSNGFIGVIPFTKLQSPDGSDVSINIYVNSDDMEFNGLTQTNMPSQRMVYTESAISSEGRQVNCLLTKPISCMDLNPSSARTDHICDDHFGERVTSFRSLLKRYVTVAEVSAAADSSAAPKILTITNQVYPANNMPYTTTAVTITRFELFSYLRACYVGMRGGIRFRSRQDVPLATNSQAWAKVSFNQPSSSFTSSAVWSASGGHKAWLMGSVSYVPITNGGIEYEFPYYSSNLFQLAFASSYEGGTATNEMSDTWYRNFNCSFDVDITNVAASHHTFECAGAEDFTLLRYNGAALYSTT